MPQDFYQENEAEEILRLATRQNLSGGMTRDALLRLAGEVGVTPEAVAAAEQQYAAAKVDVNLAAEFHRKQRVDYFEGLAGGLGSMAICYGIWYLFTRSWFFWPGVVMLAVGVNIIKDIPEHFMPSGSSYNKAFAKWKEKRAKKKERNTE